ncbi:hypothetical protein SAMN02745823_03090 [Sporobacter termitidis DSM 10068]|uniref:Uncharacterized protein n=1 Tax=Sporobacter termitidis DSM 10068 TaxID=1123282 RepID=A0A1M5Z1L2_9FIRM|nr:hypothetical protein [Sporobacter termitidis]SHI18061.1 hypothetical protein SAMN02745823_03090 [Sporobacter termitidis DSM 10068]
MVDYEKIYRALFNGIAEALVSIEQQEYVQARDSLVKAQMDAEDIFAEKG